MPNRVILCGFVPFVFSGVILHGLRPPASCLLQTAIEHKAKEWQHPHLGADSQGLEAGDLLFNISSMELRYKKTRRHRDGKAVAGHGPWSQV